MGGPKVVGAIATGMVVMSQEMPETITVPMGDLIAVSRLLWDIGSQQGTSHQHRVDCFHWGAVLDSRSGSRLTPHPAHLLTPSSPSTRE